ncbi:MAG: gephyrin-like molybdotransferase Glp [Candidatus Hydrothermarchaeaceae archaeon]
MTGVRGRGFFKKMPVGRAIKIIAANIRPLPFEDIGIANASGRVLAREVTADMDVPPFDRSAMDGYAVKGENTFGAGQSNPIYFRVIGESLSGSTFEGEVGEFEAFRIMTGGELPKGTDAVVMLEYTNKRRGGGKKGIDVIKAVPPGKNVVLRGEDIKRGDPIFKKAHVLTPHDVGICAAAGINKITVGKRPKVGIISTGDELTRPGAKLIAGQVYDINSYELFSLVKSAFGAPEMLGIIKDDYEQLKGEIKKAIKFDLVILSGATSVGEKDIIPQIVDELGKLLFHGVSMRPGGPTGIGIIKDRPIFMLPGHPAASIFGFEVFVRTALQKMQGSTPFNPYPPAEGILLKKIASEIGRRDFIWASINNKGEIEPIKTTSSGIITGISRANGFFVVPENTEGIEKGKKVTVSLFRNL